MSGKYPKSRKFNRNNLLSSSIDFRLYLFSSRICVGLMSDKYSTMIVYYFLEEENNSTEFQNSIRISIHFYIFNPFTAPSCKISGLKAAQTRLQTVGIFWSYNTSTFNAMRFYENPGSVQCEKGNKKA